MFSGRQVPVFLRIQKTDASDSSETLVPIY